MAVAWRDLRFAVRLFLKDRGFTLIALLALALGIGANTAIFSVVNAVLVLPLPFRDPNRLAMVWENSPRTGKQNVVNPQNFADWQIRNRSFESMAAYVPFRLGMSLTGDGEAEEIPGTYVTRDFLSVLGIQPFLGRDFRAEDDTINGQGVVLISYGLWQRRYGSDPKIVGRKLIRNGNSDLVVGVLAPGFHFPEMTADIWVLHHVSAGDQRGGRYLAVVARLRPGVTVVQAQEDMTGIARQLEQEQPFDAKWGAIVTPMRQQFTGSLRDPLLVLLGAVGFVLLIACANVANLMLMRASARQREMAIRSSLGATRFRIVRQLLAESLLLGIAAGLLGLAAAAWGKDLLLAMLPESMPITRLNSVIIDGNVLAFTGALSLLTAALFGLLPAIRASRPDLSEFLKEGGRAITGGLRGNRMRAALAAGELAVALVLLIGAGLLIKSFIKLQSVAPGFQPERILSLRVGLFSKRYKDDQQTAAGLDEIMSRLRRIPGVVSVGSIQFPPLGGLISATGFWVAGRPVPQHGDEPVTQVSIVTPGYFRTMGIPLLQGRVFEDHDRPGAPQVTVINQTLARQFFPDVNPIGQKLFVEWGRKTPYEIVGVAGDVKQEGLDKRAAPTVYFPNAQEPNSGATIVIRASVEPLTLARSVTDVVHSYDKDQTVADIRPLDVLLSKSVASPRFQSLLLGCFAALALLLAGIGVFGVMSYLVVQRRHEIGIRMALGAQQGLVLRMIVGQGLLLAAIGAAAGLLGAFALTRYLRTLLFEVSATDPAIFAGVTVILCAVAAAASWLPAYRATHIDPLKALRYE
jgi:putative ABC transport system permease protein